MSLLLILVMKRKADNDFEINGEVLIKSLRRSVSDFLNENETNSTILLEKFLFYFLLI